MWGCGYVYVCGIGTQTPGGTKYLLTSYFCIQIPYDEKDIFFFFFFFGVRQQSAKGVHWVQTVVDKGLT